jgi:outer membrane murein-binding lipoprotein Lpp
MVETRSTPHSVNLGCGSLILIAIIVAICSGGGGLSARIERLDADIQKLENKIEELGKAVDKLSK